MAHLGITIKTLEDGRKELSGKTFDYKEQIKGVGGTWDPARKVWTVPTGADLAFLPAPPPPPPPPPPPLSPREAYQNYLARSRKKFHGPCCSKAVCYESRPYGPLCYRCETHGQTINDYTGD